MGITLRDASKGAQALPVLILKTMHPDEGGGLAWTSYDTGLVEGPFRSEHVEKLTLTHALAVSGKVLVSALEASPEFSEKLQHIRVRVRAFRALSCPAPPRQLFYFLYEVVALCGFLFGV